MTIKLPITLNTAALTEFDIIKDNWGQVRVAFCSQGEASSYHDVISLFVREDGRHFSVAGSSCCFGDLHEFASAYARASKFVKDNNLIQERRG